jgi:tetratricopeptide (TPR) repeat protein
MDVPIEEPRWQALESRQRKQLTVDAVKRVLLRESQVQPLVLAFEDLHWIDRESQALLNTLVESLASVRVLLLVIYRPEFQHEWGSRAHYTQLRINPLAPETAEELLASLLGSDPAVASLKRQLIDRTEGNPFFIEESVRTLVETQALVGERGAYRSGRNFGTFKIPATVQAVLASRIDRLPAEDKRLLQTAAVVGKDVPVPLLQAVADIPKAELRGGLGRLQGGEFLYEATLFPELEYTFKHALTHEVAYGSLLNERRRDLHARIAGALETFHAGRLEDQADRLAHHALRGEIWERAHVYLREAGIQALRRWASRDAAGRFQQALDSLRHLPESRRTRAQALDVRIRLYLAQVTIGNYAAIPANLREAEALAGTLGDERRQAWVQTTIAASLRVIGDLQRSIAYGRSGAAAAHSLGDGLRVYGESELGACYFAAGDPRRAVEVLRPLAAELDTNRLVQTAAVVHRDIPMLEDNRITAFRAVYIRFWLTMSLAALGECTEAISVAETALKIARFDDQPLSLMLAHAGAAVASVRRGDCERTFPLAERAIAIGREWGSTSSLTLALGCLGMACAGLGRFEDARRHLREALELETRTRGAPEPNQLYQASVCELFAGNLDEARSLAEQVLAVCRERQTRAHEADSFWVLGEVAALCHPPDAKTAERHYGDALRVADELGLRPIIAHAHLGLGKLYARTGKHEQARQQLTTATTMYREMGMTYWLEKATQEFETT